MIAELIIYSSRTRPYKNFELYLEVKVPFATNSGIVLPARPKAAPTLF